MRASVFVAFSNLAGACTQVVLLQVRMRAFPRLQVPQQRVRVGESEVESEGEESNTEFTDSLKESEVKK